MGVMMERHGLSADTAPQAAASAADPPLAAVTTPAGAPAALQAS